MKGHSIEVSSAQLRMTSREIAELTQKDHGHVLRDIDSMMEQLGEDSKGYIQNWIHPQNGNTYREYWLDRRHVDCLLTGYSVVARMKVIDRWHELESGTNKIPQTFSEALRLAAELQGQIERDAPKVEFVERYVDTTGLFGFRQAAKVLDAKEHEFKAFLMKNEVIYVLGRSMAPYQRHIDSGRCVIRTGSTSGNHSYTQFCFTPKGMEWISVMWRKHKGAK